MPAKQGGDVRRRPLIGVTLMLDRPERDTHLPRYGMNTTYFDALRRAGGIPVALVPGPAEEVQRYAAPDPANPLALDGICLAGGGDIDPAHYGQARRPACGPPDVDRDTMELALLAAVRDSSLPILAICRGIQVLNVAWGGTLIQDIAAERPQAGEHYFSGEIPRDHLAHDISLTPGCRLAGILGATRLAVNSIHHQAVDALAPGLVATAWSEDGIIEAVEPDGKAGERFLIGIQCHPEDLPAQAPMRKLFTEFAAAARDYRTARLGF